VRISKLGLEIFKKIVRFMWNFRTWDVHRGIPASRHRPSGLRAEQDADAVVVQGTGGGSTRSGLMSWMTAGPGVTLRADGAADDAAASLTWLSRRHSLLSLSVTTCITVQARASINSHRYVCSIRS